MLLGTVSLDVRTSDIDPAESQLIITELTEEIGIRSGDTVRIGGSDLDSPGGNDVVEVALFGGATQTLLMLRRQGSPFVQSILPKDPDLRRERIRSLVAQVFTPLNPEVGPKPPAITAVSEPRDTSTSWVLVGMGTAAMVASVVFAVAGQQKNDELRELERINAEFESVSSDRTLLLSTSIALLIGGAVTVGAGTLIAE